MGFILTTHAQAYSQLVALHERDHSDKVGNLLLSKLKGLLAGESSCPTSQKDKTCQKKKKLMNELQARKRLGWVRNNGGHVLSDPLSIARALEQHWTEVTTPGLASVEDCMAFLRKLNLPPNFSVMARGLFRPLSESLVAEA